MVGSRGSVKAWLLRGIIASLGLCLLLVAAALLILHSLDRSWIKPRVQALVLNRQGLEIDYHSAQFRELTGLTLQGLVVRSPQPVRSAAPVFLRAGRVHLRWTTSSLLGDAPPLALELDQVALSVVLDEHGRTTFDALPPSASPPVPLSRQAEDLLETTRSFSSIRARGLSAEIVRSQRTTAVERFRLDGLSLDAQRSASNGSPSVALLLGTQAVPLRLVLTRTTQDLKAATANASCVLGIRLSRSELEATGSVRVSQQDFVKAGRFDELLKLRAKFAFEPRARRTQLELTDLVLAGGIAEGSVSAELPDTGAPLLRRAHADVDLGRLLELLPPGVIPAQARAGRLQLTAQDFSWVTPLPPSAVFRVNAEAQGLTLFLGATRGLSESARAELELRPSDGGVSASGTLSLQRPSIELDKRRWSSDEITLQLGMTRDAHRRFTGDAAVTFAALTLDGATTLESGPGHLKLIAKQLALSTRTPVVTHGELSLELDVDALDLGTARRLQFRAPRLRANVRAAEHDALAAWVETSAVNVRVLTRNGRSLGELSLRERLELNELKPNLERPERTTAELRSQLELGDVTARILANKQEDAVDYDLRAETKSSSALRAWLPEAWTERVPLDKLALELSSKGRVQRLASPDRELVQHAKLRVTAPAYGAAAARALSLELNSNGSVLRQRLRGNLQVEALTIDGHALGNDQLALSAEFDRTQHNLRLELVNRGLFEADISTSLAFDSGDRSLNYRHTSRVSALSALAPLLARQRALAGFDLEQLAVRVRADGRVFGLFPGKELRPRLSPDPLNQMSVQGNAEVQVEKLRWAERDQAYSTSAATLKVQLRKEPGHYFVESDLTADPIKLGFGRYHVTLDGLRDRVELHVAGNRGEGRVELSQTLGVRSVEQNLLRWYPVADLGVQLRAQRDADGVYHLQTLKVDNAGGGTHVELSGDLDLSADQRRVALRTRLEQDLSRCSTREDRFTGRGKAQLEATLESPDFRILRARGAIKLADADLRLPRWGIVLEAIEGEVPISSDLTFGQRGLALLRGVQINPYTMLRFADQHPLLNARSFVTMRRLTTPYATLAPFAANLQVDQNVVSLSQLEFGVRGGSISGAGMFEWDRNGSRIHADIRANGVKSSHDEPFDGNAALLIDLRDHSVEGRADILRIGRRHLYELLDFQDPNRMDPALNRIRSGLELGYPERVRIAFKHGFANAGVTFGGLASLVSVSDIRGIPVGPLMERIMQSVAPAEEP